MPVCYVLCGVPAAGKSTWRENWGVPNDFVYSTDDIVEEEAKRLGKTYDEVFPQVRKVMIGIANARLDEAIRLGKHVVWDQTNLTVNKRGKIIRRMSQAGYDVVAIYFQKPKEDTHEIDEWIRRLESRKGKSIPADVLLSMYRQDTVPTVEEGFIQVTIHNSFRAWS